MMTTNSIIDFQLQNESFGELILNRLNLSFEKLLMLFTDFVPKLIIAVIILLVGWIIAKFVRSIMRKVLEKAHVDSFSEKIGLDKIFVQISKKLKLSSFIASIFYYLILFVFITISTDILGLEMVTDGVAALIAYLPKIVTAFILFIIGFFLADIVKNTVFNAANSIGISGARVIANIIFYILLIFVVITALNQAGVDTELITQNLTLILGGILLAFSLAYAFASRQILRNMLSSFYRKGKFMVGQKIRLNDVEGEIESIDNISVSIRTKDSTVVFPCKMLVEEKVEILD